MPNVINYEKKMSTGYSKDGYLVVFTKDPQKKGSAKIEKLRKLTREEIIKSNKSREQYGKPSIFNKGVLECLKRR